jgi:hypothetical protein
VALTILGLRPNKLAFPGTKPGLDRAHPAFIGLQQVAVVFQPNGNFYDLKNGVRSNITPGAGQFANVVDSIIGPAMAPSASNTSANIINVPKALAGGNVYADIVSAIMRFPASALGAHAYLVTNNVTGNTIFLLYIPSGTTILTYADSGGSVNLLDFTPILGHPVFIAICNYNASVNWVVRSLLTGRTFSGTVAAFSTITPDLSGSYLTVGNRDADYLRPATGSSIAAVMYAESIPYQLSSRQLLQWADDPWSFWYPQRIDLAEMLNTAPTVAVTTKGATLPIMGVG